MEIKAQNFEMKMTHEELWATAWDVRRAFEHCIYNHWAKLQGGNGHQVWEHNEAPRLFRLKMMFSALGRLDLYEDTLMFASTVFKELLAKTEKETIQTADTHQ